MAEINLPTSPLYSPVVLLEEDDFDFSDFDDPDKRKEIIKEKSGRQISKSKALLLSLLVPGAGQYYGGRKDRAEVFIGAEVAIWLGCLAFNTHGNWKKDEYINYAVRHAGVDPFGKDDHFYKSLTFYDSRKEYNKVGPATDYSAPYYYAGTGYDWYWDDDESRAEYRSIRNTSKSAFRNATFMIGVAVANRIIAGIDALRIATKLARIEEDGSFFSSHNIDFDIDANPFGNNPRVDIAVSHRF